MTTTRLRRGTSTQGFSGWAHRWPLLGLLVAMILAAGTTAAPAGAVDMTEGGRLLDVTAHDNGSSGGEQHDFYTLNTDHLKAGLVQVRLHNVGSVAHQVQLLRLHDGITLDAFQSAVAATHGGAVLQLADATGGSNAIDPGGYQATFVNLHAGNYVALCFLSDGGDGAPHFAHGMLSAFSVAGKGNSAHPPGHVLGSIEAFSFGYRMPAVVDGHGLYRFTNTDGRDTHEFTVLRLAPGKTAADFLSWLQAGANGPPPVAGSGGGANALAPGLHMWVQLNLAPGDYVAVCFVPDDEGDHPPHAVLGMVQGFTAT